MLKPAIMDLNATYKFVGRQDRMWPACLFTSTAYFMFPKKGLYYADWL